MAVRAAFIAARWSMAAIPAIDVASCGIVCPCSTACVTADVTCRLFHAVSFALSNAACGSRFGSFATSSMTVFLLYSVNDVFALAPCSISYVAKFMPSAYTPAGTWLTYAIAILSAAVRSCVNAFLRALSWSLCNAWSLRQALYAFASFSPAATSACHFASSAANSLSEVSMREVMPSIASA